MISLLITVILLIGGKGAAHALIECEGIVGFGGGRDDTPISLLEADSRGAVIMESQPATYPCHAWKGDYAWSGEITFKVDHEIIEITLFRPSK